MAGHHSGEAWLALADVLSSTSTWISEMKPSNLYLYLLLWESKQKMMCMWECNIKQERTGLRGGKGQIHDYRIDFAYNPKLTLATTSMLIATRESVLLLPRT